MNKNALFTQFAMTFAMFPGKLKPHNQNKSIIDYQKRSEEIRQLAEERRQQRKSKQEQDQDKC